MAKSASAFLRLQDSILALSGLTEESRRELEKNLLSAPSDGPGSTSRDAGAHGGRARGDDDVPGVRRVDRVFPGGGRGSTGRAGLAEDDAVDEVSLGAAESKAMNSRFMLPSLSSLETIASKSNS